MAFLESAAENWLFRQNVNTAWAFFLWIWLVNQLSKHAMQKEKDKAVALFTIRPLPSYLQPHYVSFASQIHLCSFLGKDAVSQPYSFYPPNNNDSYNDCFSTLIMFSFCFLSFFHYVPPTRRPSLLCDLWPLNCGCHLCEVGAYPTSICTKCYVTCPLR